MKKPLVSIIITTKNEEKNIENCLISLKNQSYVPLEIIVVDNNSSDNTRETSLKYTKDVYLKGPERSIQRNYGVERAKGKYVLILDADMVLTKNVVRDCVEAMSNSVKAIIIPEKSYGVGFWAQCKALERSYYVGVDWIEAARFFDKELFLSVGGFDTGITGPEDWDLSQRVLLRTKVKRISSYILHNEGNLSLFRTLKKKMYYAKRFAVYSQKSENTLYSAQQANPLKRYMLFFSSPGKLFQNPFLGIGMLFMKTLEYGAGVLGVLKGKIEKSG